MASDCMKLLCKNTEIQLMGTLNGGQSFRWKKIETSGVEQWLGVFASKVWILEQIEDGIQYKVYDSFSERLSNNEYNEILSDYLHLDVDISEYYARWSEKDPHFKKAAQQFCGLRILRQDVIENIFSFICSHHNYISRITGMVEKLVECYGEKICDIDGKTYYSFPKVEKLAESGVEDKLREIGFGDRGEIISNTAKTIVDGGGQKWIDELKRMKYDEAKKKLRSLKGIGAKVADCICLMSLGHLQAVPIDTHVYHLAARLYMAKLPKQKNVTEKLYNEIGDYFRGLHGPLAGWAHMVMFCAGLKIFQDNKESATKPKKSKRQKTS